MLHLRQFMKLYIVLLLLFCSEFAFGQVITTVAGNGINGFSGDGNPATNASISGILGITLDKYNNIYIADRMNNRIRKVDVATGIINTIAGTGIAGFGGDGGLADTARFNEPGFLAFDSIGNLYISDYSNHRIRKIDTNGFISTYAGTGASGGYGDYVPASSATFISVGGIATDVNGNLYITDISDYKIREIEFSTSIIHTVAGTGIAGFTGDGDLAKTATIDFVHDLTVDRIGNIYLADETNQRIRKITSGTGIINTIVGTGAFAWTGDSLPATLSPINPYSVAVDEFGNVFIADSYNNRIRKMNFLTNILTTIAGNGTAGFLGDGESADSAEFNNLGHVCFDNCGNLFIVDGDNFRIRKVTIPQPPPTISITASDDSFCAGNSVTLMSSYAASLPGTAGYQWIVNGSEVSGATNSSYNYNPASGDSVRCVLTFASNCGGAIVSSNTVNMTLVSSITPTIALPTGFIYASAGTVITVNAALTDTPISYLINWFNKGVWFAGTTTPWVTYTKTMAIDSITAHIAPSGFCYDSAVSGIEVVIDSVLGLQHVMAGTGVRFYPNPAHDVLAIVSGNSMQTIELMNVYGKVVEQLNVSGNNKSINVKELPTGLYFVQVDGVMAGKFLKE